MPAPQDSGRAREAARRPELDGLRGLAALAVLVFHAWMYSMLEPDASRRGGLDALVYSNLRLGLVLFFVLSALLLYGPWVRAALEGGEVMPLRRYLGRRLARVLPGYYVALAGSLALVWGLAGTPGVRLPEAGELWTFVPLLQNYFDGPLMSLNPPMWSLVVELSFYLVLPLLGWVALRCAPTRAAQLAVPLAVLAVGLAWNAYLTDHRAELPQQLGKLLPTFLPYFAFGMVAAVLVHGRRMRTGAGVALVAAGCALVWLNVDWRMAHEGEQPTFIVRDVLAAAGFAAILAGAAAAPLRRALAWGPLAFLGAISYGVYLWHVPIMWWLRGNHLLPLEDPIGATVVALPLTLLAAAASWYAVEQPLMRRVRDGRRRREQARARTAGERALRPAPEAAR